MAATLASDPTHASGVQFESIALGGNDYRFVYTVTNHGSQGAAIEGFDVFFDPALYLESSLRIVTPAAVATSWDESLLASGVLVPAAYEAIAVAGGVLAQSSESGFAVEFTWLGNGLPGSQPFEIFDPATFEVLESGATTAVPESDADWSAVVALAICTAIRGARTRPGRNGRKQALVRGAGRSLR